MSLFNMIELLGLDAHRRPQGRHSTRLHGDQAEAQFWRIEAHLPVPDPLPPRHIKRR